MGNLRLQINNKRTMDMDMEEAPLMMEDKPASQAGSAKSKTSKASKASKAGAKPKAAAPAGPPKPTKDDYCACCCCSIQVSDPNSREQRCCFCFPLKAGIFALIVIAFNLVWIVLMSKNKYYSGWYVFFEFLLLFPTFVAVAFFIYYLAGDTKASRGRVTQGFGLFALSVLLMGLASIIYITSAYPEDKVFIGYGEISEEGEEMRYTSETKKEFVYE